MRILLTTTLGLMLLALITGCGGGGGTGITNSPFAGSYSGTWSSATSGQSGTASITVATNGKVTGSVTITSGGSGVGAVSATIQNSGEVSGSVQYPEQSKSTINGTLVLNNNVLSGNLIQRLDGVNYTVAFSLNKS